MMPARVATSFGKPTTSDEKALVERYRHGELTQHELSLALGLGRLEVDSLLKKYGVTDDLPDAGEYESALSHLHQKTAE